MAVKVCQQIILLQIRVSAGRILRRQLFERAQYSDEIDYGTRRSITIEDMSSRSDLRNSIHKHEVAAGLKPLNLDNKSPQTSGVSHIPIHDHDPMKTLRSRDFS